MGYYKQGDAARAEEIKAAFEKLGVYVGGYDFGRKDVLFFTFEAKGKTHLMSSVLGTGLDNIILTHPDYKELELPKPHYDIANFHAGMPVLVRDKDNRKWCYLLYSHYDNTYDDGLCFNAGSVDWRQCIPYNDDTKRLLGTTDMCPEEYINW